MKIWKFLLFGFVIYLLYLLLDKIGLELIINRILKVNILFVILAFISSLLTYLMMNLRWKIIMDRIGNVKFMSLLMNLFAGQFISAITPSAKAGGEPVRAYFLSEQTGLSKTKIFATIILDKFFNLLVFAGILIPILGYTIFFVGMPNIFNLIFEIILLAVIFAFAFIFVFRKSLKLIYFEWILFLMHKIWFIKKKWKEYEHFKEIAVSKARSFYEVFNENFDDKTILIKSLFLSVLIWMFSYVTTYLLFLSFGYKINILSLLIASTIAVFFGDVSLSPGGVAIAEGAAIIMYFYLDVNLVVAAGVVLLERMIYYLISIGIGGPIFSYLHFKGK